jgi:molybdopterin molybdotransferase
MNHQLPDYEQALVEALRPVEALKRIESVGLDQAVGRVLSNPVRADRDLPPFNRAQMDGYAVRAADLARSNVLPVESVVAAGASGQVEVPAGSCVRIATGAPLPEGLDTVIEHERTDRGDLHGGPVTFRVDAVVNGQAVHRCGSDAKAGQTLIASGTALHAAHIGIAAAVGCTTLQVCSAPRVAILTSGDEVVDPSTPTASLPAHHIRNSNGPMLQAMLPGFGAGGCTSIHVPDDRTVTISTVQSALEAHDLVITVGGVSAGERDYFPMAYQACGVSLSLHGASIQPGKPVAVGRNAGGSVIIGLPGNPVSVLACAHLFVWPIIRAMMRVTAALPWRSITLAEAVKANSRRRAFRPAVLLDQQSVVVPNWAGSGDLSHTAATHGLLELPIQSESVPKGAELRFLAWP